MCECASARDIDLGRCRLIGTPAALRHHVTSEPTVRDATDEDLADVQRLFGQPVALPREPGRRHLLVLDAPDDGGLAAAALVKIEGRRGHLALLAVDHRYEGLGIENRMIAVTEALCKAFGADTLEVSARRAA